MKRSLTLSAIAISITALLSGCTLDGDAGATGPAGVAGPQGEQGVQGDAGVDASRSISLSLVGRALIEAEEGSAEIIQYHASSQTVYATWTAQNKVAMIPLANIGVDALNNTFTADTLSETSFNIESTVSGVTIAGMNSLAVNGDLLAVAVEPEDKTAPGYILFYNDLNNSNPTFMKAVTVGSLPDMVTFTPDGTKVIVANEGEPNDDYSVDPNGSVSIIAVSNNVPADTATTLILDAATVGASKAELATQNVLFPSPADGTIINGNTITTSLAADLEPEYVTATNEIAYVSLQENNALAIVDLSDNSVSIKALGFKSWDGLQIDAQEDGTVSFGQYDGLVGAYMPDTITNYTWNGSPFIVTANEGDAREYFFDVADEAACTAANGLDYDVDDGCLAWIDEYKIKDIEDAGITVQADSALEKYLDSDIDSLRITMAAGDMDNNGELDTPVAYGARSFSIWDQNGNVIYDSGDDMEVITAALYGANFNNTDDENAPDDRSENKGPEPEAVTVGMIDDKQYAFIGLERTGGVMVYDVTNPFAVSFVDYVNNRDLTEGLDISLIGDLAPESIVFVPANDSPTNNALLLVGYEVSGTVSVYQITPR
ncbi:MAG: Uncharacterised protein [Glaciecola sp. HTCC2999]|nr:MAG: Uncharacterised protein [Glaciecola sp. HTCC2999]